MCRIPPSTAPKDHRHHAATAGAGARAIVTTCALAASGTNARPRNAFHAPKDHDDGATRATATGPFRRLGCGREAPLPRDVNRAARHLQHVNHLNVDQPAAAPAKAGATSAAS